MSDQLLFTAYTSSADGKYTHTGVSFSHRTGVSLVDPLCARPPQLFLFSVNSVKLNSTNDAWVQCEVDIYHVCHSYAVKQLAKGAVSSSSFRGSCVAVY